MLATRQAALILVASTSFLPVWSRAAGTVPSPPERPSFSPTRGRDWDALFAQAGLTPERAQLDPNRWRGGGAYSLSVFERLWGDWRLVDGYSISSARELLRTAPSFRALVDAASRRIDAFGAGESPPPVDGPRQSPSDQFVSAIARIHDFAEAPLGAPDLERLRRQAGAVPPSTARAAATLLRAVPMALQARRRSLRAFGGDAEIAAAYDRVVSFGVGLYDVDPTILHLVETVDLPTLVEGGRALATAMDRAISVFREDRKRRYSCRWQTPYGKIALGGSSDDVYDAPPYLLILDGGGNDQYRFGAGARRAQCPISLIADLGGDDRYESDVPGAFGAGILGYGLLYDASGSDQYRTVDGGPGTGLFGVGILLDRSGNDEYVTRALGEGAGVFGIGILSDLGGGDSYRCLMAAQGFGGVRGCGALVDCSGDDVYDADDAHIVAPSPQTDQHNTSLAQGCGFGRRADPGDGHSMAGGVGMLVDREGNDRYNCGVFGQGTAYWYALGFLVDLGGSDKYDGVWYCQGSSAHYAVAALCDLQGNDRYHVSMHQSQGQGHDYSIGLLHDARGDDSYVSDGSGALGTGRWNGIGIFWDESGRNDYRAGAESFGAVGDSRPESLCLGLFLDTGGKALFPPDQLAKRRSRWIQPRREDRPLAWGLGLSR